MNTLDQIRAAMATLEIEDAKFVAGNAAAGARARKSLSDISKLVKARRAEITEEKNSRKVTK
jgi:hypothetical protein